MFCGWRLINSYQDIERLGSGVLSIDALSGACTFNGSSIAQLSIGGELFVWLRKDLSSHGIPAESLRQARLEVELRLSQIDASDRAADEHHLTRKGQPVRKGGFNRLQIQCRSDVTTDETAYASTCLDLKEWPVGWPT
jgi:hypothetical protein